MPKNRIRYDSIYKAREMYAVLIQKTRESRSYTKKEMLSELTDKDLYCEFLKTCFEFDDSENLNQFRKGLYLILTSFGMSTVSKDTGIPRTTIYRMLWNDGNPNLKYLMRLLKWLDLQLWVVTGEFINTAKTSRFKHAKSSEVVGAGNRRL